MLCRGHYLHKLCSTLPVPPPSLHFGISTAQRTLQTLFSVCYVFHFSLLTQDDTDTAPCFREGHSPMLLLLSSASAQNKHQCTWGKEGELLHPDLLMDSDYSAPSRRQQKARLDSDLAKTCLLSRSIAWRGLHLICLFCWHLFRSSFAGSVSP